MAKTETFKSFTDKWKKYVEDNKEASEIPEEDWKQFFAPSNPVAGINFGALTDKLNKGQTISERKTILNEWNNISNHFNELYKLEPTFSDEEIKQNLKGIRTYILKKISDNQGRDCKVAINRLLVTLYPKKLLTIPGEDDVVRLAELLEKSVDNKDWIDFCFEIKTELENRYPNMMHWWAYLQLVQEKNLTKNFNLILTGAPGTGKTFLARQMAANIIKCDVKDLENKDQFGFVQFHPSYDYTDFVEGLRTTKDINLGQIVFERKDGIFKSFCAKAANDTGKKYVFVIDEINRGEISKIFGELFFSIDPGYRKKKDRILVQTQYHNLIIEDGELPIKEQKLPNDYPFKKGFYVPENVYVIGTMNDIDRSVESMDFAFRRRFSFYEVKAEDTQYSILKDCKYLDTAINKMNSLNKAIENIEGLSSAFHIGAAYFKKIKLYEKERDCWNLLWNNHLKGLLFEYLRGLPPKDIKNKMEYLKTVYDKPVEISNDQSSAI